jgi:predicted membrane protein
MKKTRKKRVCNLLEPEIDARSLTAIGAYTDTVARLLVITIVVVIRIVVTRWRAVLLVLRLYLPIARSVLVMPVLVIGLRIRIVMTMLVWRVMCESKSRSDEERKQGDQWTHLFLQCVGCVL